jgi:hypothetical protein
MGVDSNFYFRTSINPDDIMKALEALGRTGIKYEPTTSPGYVQILFDSNTEGWNKRQMHFFHNISNCFGFECNHVSLRANDESVEVFTQLAKMIGGLVQKSDCSDNTVEMYETPGSGNIRWLLEQYFLKNVEPPRDSKDQVREFTAFTEER